MFPEIRIEQCNFYCFRGIIVKSDLYYREVRYLIFLSVANVVSKVRLKRLVSSFGLSISFRVKRC